MPALPTRLLLCLLLGALFCCGEKPEPRARIAPPQNEDPSPQPGLADGSRMGPLANAGPDQRALPGMVVRLDGRGTLPPEDARPYSLRWLQESGPGVHLSDPTSAVTEFVAPPIRPGESNRLAFRLVADDGSLSSKDRVVVEIVGRSQELSYAPVAVAAEDIEAGFGEEVHIPAPSFLEPSCLDGEDPETCLHEPLPHCWTQVHGQEVELHGACGEEPTTFIAPDRDALLIFRLDAHGRGEKESPASCGPEVERPEATPLCATPDYLRVVVRSTPRRGDIPPSTWWRFRNEEQARVGLLVIEEPALEVPQSLDLMAGARDEEDLWKLVSFFRPVLGRVPTGLRTSQLRIDAPPWPGPVAIAFETLFYTHRTQGGQSTIEWYHGAPPLALVAWRPPTDLPPPHADAGPLPCGLDQPDPWVCDPVAPGEEVALQGSFGGHEVGSTPQTCWEQTFGPEVALSPGSGCLPNQGTRTFIAPTPAGGEPLELAFQFTVNDGGPYSSRPSTLWFQVRQEGVVPPDVSLEGPATLAPGASGVLDASRSVDPEGGPLRFGWRQLEGHSLGIRACSGEMDAQTSCVVVTAPIDAEGSVVIEVEASSQASKLISRRSIEFSIVGNDDGEEPPP